MEDLQADLSTTGLTVSTAPEKGRCLLSTKDFYPGEVIISQEPFVSVPNNSSVHSRCERCFRSSNLKKCSGCHVVWYCGSTCQKSDWKFHRLECNALSRLEKERRKSLTPSIRLMVKLYIQRKLQSEKIMPTSARDSYHLVEALVSHITDIDEQQLVLYAQMANLVNLILQWPDINIKEVAENFAKLACNAHTICDSELRPLGTGLYPVISIINHSCLPNSVLVFEERLAVVRAVQYIPKGTEVLISYIETAGSTINRRKALKEQYFFTCMCPRCIKMGQYDDICESAILEGYRCKDDRCDGFLLRDSDDKGFICQQCGLLRIKEEIEKLASEIKSLPDKATLSSSSHYLEATSIHKMIEKLQAKLFHPFSISLMRTREAILKILMECKDWGEALVYCKLTIPVYQLAGKSTSPMSSSESILDILRSAVDSSKSLSGIPPFAWTAILYMWKAGMMSADVPNMSRLLGKTEDAVKSLTKAADILQITHGTNTPFMKELLLKLEEACAEASYKLSSKDL